MAAARSVLITGCSTGIGRATAARLADAGWTVYATARKPETLAELEAKGCRVMALDVTDEASMEAAVAAVEAPLGALVNNAGVIDVPGRVDTMAVQRLERMFAINVIGSFVCAREAVKRLSTKHGGPGGAIVNLSSAAARLGAPGQYVDYAAAKGGIDVFTLGLAKEVATEGIRVNAVRPGIIETDIHASGGQPDRAREMAPLVPMQRAGSAEEVAEAIVWLLSDASSYTTGAVIDVTGGR
jgi:NAD(P)-dependent dehydrogenase (short-subunit alcohol dehydrogenase family)